jgi:UDP-N-acetylmuramoyl-L-alanyl-D-glutamate--2,6-diaminopimelate ligase
MITLKDIFKDFPLEILQGNPTSVGINNIVSDSRLVEFGSLFVAVTGGSKDGHLYISDAINRGAAAVVGEQPNSGGISVPYIQVQNSRQSLSHLAAAFYGHPARKLTMIGITGTDGKTTTCNLLYQILLTAGIKVGMISTVNAVIGTEIFDTGFHVTTPDTLDVQHYLVKMVEAGLTHVILETTSHGLAQYRVDACEFDIGVITNITHEHLDYHGTYENYRAAKARLFTGLADVKSKKQGNIRLGVLNRDDASYDYLRTITSVQQVCYGLNSKADIQAKDIKYDPSGVDFTILCKEIPVSVKSTLVGAFNVSNILAAFTTAVFGLRISTEIAVKGIGNLTCVPGRMERIDLGQNFTAIVDFAHTPNALKSALQTARQITDGRLIVVFGSAGLRDRQKRRMMAEVASDLANMAILTAEDPRTESLEDILEDMAKGAVARGGIEQKTFRRIPDRGNAIRFAVQMAEPGDLVIACGKGHEQSMCFGEIEYPWDDGQAMRSALAELLGLPPINMSYLPTQTKKS